MDICARDHPKCIMGDRAVEYPEDSRVFGAVAELAPLDVPTAKDPTAQESGPRIRALVYDECEVYRLGTGVILQNAADIVVVGAAATITDAVHHLRMSLPNVVVMGTASQMAAAASVLAIREQLTRPTPVLVLATTLDHDLVLPVLEAGARGYLHRNTSATRLVAAVRSVAEGEMVLTACAADSFVQLIAEARDGGHTTRVAAKDDSPLAGLTSRQHEVLMLVAEGLPNAEIARRLQLSVGTVKSHLSAAMQKFAVRDRTQLAVMAYQTGLGRPAADRPE
jgi:DNA-binding NarL/FixJ family response regulator